MTYLLDTNTCIEYLNRRESFIKRRLALVPPADVRLCSIVKAELYDGAHRSSHREQNLDLLKTVFSRFVSLPFDDSAAEIYGRVRAELSGRGMPIGPNDLIVSAIAIANHLTLVTQNIREFSRVKGLVTEDWQASED